MTPPQRSIHSIYLRVNPADIALVKFLIESYEGIGVVRTVDRRAAIIVVLVVSDFLTVARELLDELHGHIPWDEVAPEFDESDDWLMREIDEDG